MFIPGIEDLLKIPNRRNEVRENSRKDNDSLPSANAIPIALPQDNKVWSYTHSRFLWSNDSD